MPIRYAVFLGQTGLESAVAAAQLTSDKMFGTDLYKGYTPPNIYKHQIAYWRGFWKGNKKALEQSITGLTSRDYFQKEIKQNLQPWESAKKFFRVMTRQEKASLNNTLNAAIEATFGWYSEFIARGLNLGDKPFRFGAEYAIAEKLAQEKGLSGIAKEIFMLAPDEKSEQTIREYGEEITFQQQNAITKTLDMLEKTLVSRISADESWAKNFSEKSLKAFRYLNLPFLNTLINVFKEYLLVTNPAFSVLPLAHAAIKGDVSGVYKNGARLMVALSVQYVAIQLVQAGLLTSSDDDDEEKREREGRTNYERSGTLNFSGLKRLLAGYDPSPKDDDVYIELKAYGFLGMALLAKANQYNSDEKVIDKENSIVADIINGIPFQAANGLMDGVFGNIGSLLSAISMGGRYADNYLSSTLQIAVPIPAVITAASRADDNYVRDTRGENWTDDFMNKLKVRFFSAKDLPISRNIWGEEKTRVPEGNNLMLWHFFGLNRGSTLDQDKFGYVLYNLYKKSGEEKLFPPSIKRDLSGVDLTAKQYEQLSILVGSHRKQLVEAYITGNDLEKMKKDKVIDKLQKKYKQGYILGLTEFMKLNPDVQKEKLNQKLEEQLKGEGWTQ
jgi:hypothetical protein